MVDEGLHVPKKKSPNWSPSVGILNWAALTFNEEWSADQVKEYEDKYVPSEEYEHLFSPIPLSKAMEEQLSSQFTKDTDYLFNRRETERLMFRACRDICASYGPFIEVLDLLGAKGDCKKERGILSEGILGVVSGVHKITRARRELFRRYFRIEVAKILYTNDPSHSQFFGGTSLGDRVKEAQDFVTTRNSMFFLPKSKNYSNSNKASSKSKSKGFQENASDQRQPPKQRRGSRGRGRRGKAGKGRSSKSPADKSK